MRELSSRNTKVLRRKFCSSVIVKLVYLRGLFNVILGILDIDTIDEFEIIQIMKESF